MRQEQNENLNIEASNKRSRNRHKAKWRHLLLLPFSLIAILLGIYYVWYMIFPMSDEEKALTDDKVVAVTRYVVVSNDSILFGFEKSKGDSLLVNVGGESRDTVNAQWARRWPLLPYSGNTLAVEAYDSTRIIDLTHQQVLDIIRKQQERIQAFLENAVEQRNDIDYYLKTHTVIDEGFDIVARYSKEHERSRDSLSKVNEALLMAMSQKNLSVRMERRYYYYCTADKEWEECKVKYADSLIMLKSPAETPYQPLRRDLSRGEAMKRLASRRPAPVKTYVAHIDSIGTYEGKRDSIGNPHGIGRFTGTAGDYYEGEWNHGVRSGVGFSMKPGVRLRMGEWKDNNFLGERIEYNPERIYGIDISRYQHEEVKMVKKRRRWVKKTVRFPFNWKDLRITSLGTQSKKNIKGEVNYPVRFIYIKATEGTTVKNEYFHGDYANSRKYGYRTGAYHFFSLKTTGEQQANFFIRNSRYNKGDLPPVLDVEPTDAQIKAAGGIIKIFRNVRSWLYNVERQLGVKPILYVSQRFVNKYLNQAPDIKKGYEVWIARYGEYKPDVNLVYWQLSQDGRVNGIKTTVDINVYNGFDFK